jgi:dTDP-4-amino-4,6-dideoxygalactose transaminase
VIRVPDRDRLRTHLQSSGIGTEVYYPIPLHLQPCFRGLGHRSGSFPVSEAAANEVLALPIYGELTEAQQSWVVESIRDFLQRRA